MSTYTTSEVTGASSAQDRQPAPGTWDIDPGHTEVAFIGRHFLVTKVRGRFRNVEGVVEVADGSATVDVNIDMTSVESGSDARDEHLRSAELFDVDAHPRATFSGSTSAWSGSRGAVSGELTIRGVARPVTLDVTYHATVADPWGGERAIFSASAKLDRRDFGIGWNMPLDGGGLLVSNEISLEIEVETVRRR